MLSDLHCSVNYIALYGSDLLVAIQGLYPVKAQQRLDVGTVYQREFNESFTFAATNVGTSASQAASAPGAWIAFRESITDMGYNVNNSDYFQLLQRSASESTGFAGLDARVNGSTVPVEPNQTIAGLKTIGSHMQVPCCWCLM